MNRIARELAGNLQYLIPGEARVESYRDKNLNTWRDTGSYSPVSCSKTKIEIKVNPYEFGEYAFAEIQHLLNQATEHRAHLVSSLSQNFASPSWLFVSAYYASLYIALAWTRATNSAVIYLDKPAIAKYSFSNLAAPASGAFIASLTTNTLSESVLQIIKSKKSHFHDATWLNHIHSSNNLLSKISAELENKTPTEDEFNSVRILRLFEGYKFEDPFYWPSLLRNAVNYRPGYSYRSIPKHNFLSLDFIKKPLRSDRLQATIIEAERLKNLLKDATDATALPNEAASLMVLQSSLIEACISEAIDILCKNQGFKNTPLIERRQFAKKNFGDSTCASRGVTF